MEDSDDIEIVQDRPQLLIQGRRDNEDEDEEDELLCSLIEQRKHIEIQTQLKEKPFPNTVSYNQCEGAEVIDDPQASQTLKRLRESQVNKLIEKEISQLVSGMDLLRMGNRTPQAQDQEIMVIDDENDEDLIEISFEILLTEDSGNEQEEERWKQHDRPVLLIESESDEEEGEIVSEDEVVIEDDEDVQFIGQTDSIEIVELVAPVPLQSREKRRLITEEIKDVAIVEQKSKPKLTDQ